VPILNAGMVVQKFVRVPLLIVDAPPATPDDSATRKVQKLKMNFHLNAFRV